jgi:ABC-2 type transport system permease protein
VPERFNPALPFLTLLRREILRFMSICAQTLVTPLMTICMYLLVFGLGLGSRIELPGPHSYLQYIVPGLAVMGVVQNSFSNSSSSLFMARYLGYIVDLLVIPLGEKQLVLAYALAATLRGLIVAAAALLLSCTIVDLPWPRPLEACLALLLCSFVFALLGVLAALFSSSLEALAMFSNFFILPLVYLGGLFYPVEHLGPVWLKIAQVNPLYHVMESFRTCALGSLGPASGYSLIYLAASVPALFIACCWASRRLRP